MNSTESGMQMQLNTELIEKISSMPWGEIAKLRLEFDSLVDENFLSRFENSDEIVKYLVGKHTWIEESDNTIKRDFDKVADNADYLLWNTDPSGVLVKDKTHKRRKEKRTNEL